MRWDGALRGRAALVCALLAAASACTSGSTPQGKPAPSATGPTGPSGPTAIPTAAVTVAALTARPPAEKLPAFRSVSITKANYPSGLAVAPDGRIFYSELYSGRIRVISPVGVLQPKPWADVNEIYDISWKQFFHGGLSGIAFDPSFASNHFVYVVTQVPDAKTELPAKSLIVRFREQGGRGVEPKVLLEIPASKFDNIYSLVFGPDGMLYVPSGQNTNRKAAADPLKDLLGKVLRVKPDGTAPGDNPYGDRAPLVWATGIRNAFDIAFDPATGFALGGENGTTSHDELNLLMPGHDYGHPDHRGAVDVPGMTQPLLDYGNDRVAPTGTAYYGASRFAALKGAFLVCHNHGPGLFAVRVDTKDPARLIRMTKISDRCSIDVAVAPDGSIYMSDSTSIYRLTI